MHYQAGRVGKKSSFPEKHDSFSTHPIQNGETKTAASATQFQDNQLVILACHTMPVQNSRPVIVRFSSTQSKKPTPGYLSIGF
jgi:hypothetical protein